MKINPQQELLKAQLRRPAATRPTGPGGTFADLLRARMDAAAANTAAGPPAGPIPLSGVQMTAPFGPGGPTPVERTEHLLSLMDAYRHQLADGSTSLRQIAPTVERMAAALPALEASCERLPSEDGLRRLATEAMVTARTEIARFQRGDYVE